VLISLNFKMRACARRLAATSGNDALCGTRGTTCEHCLHSKTGLHLSASHNGFYHKKCESERRVQVFVCGSAEEWFLV